MKLCVSPAARSSSSLIVPREAGLAFAPVKVDTGTKQMERCGDDHQWTGIDLAMAGAVR